MPEHPTLEEVLVAFQKSLSRARQNAQQVAAADQAFARGEKALFLVEAIEVELKVGLAPAARSVAPTPAIKGLAMNMAAEGVETATATEETDASPELRLVFDAPSGERSSLRFRVVQNTVIPTGENDE